MSTLSISGYNASSAPTTQVKNDRAQTAETKALAASSARSTQAAVQDTVKITAAAQAHVLKQQGMSVAQIANQLATDTKTVDEYLGITSTSSSSAAQGLALLESM